MSMFLWVKWERPLIAGKWRNMPVQNHEKIMEDALKREFQHCMFSHAPPRVHIQQSQDPPELEINLGMAVDDGAPAAKFRSVC
uniref:Uncharacterized protein n=1 Tax=Oryza rufipogon TaxID=4529 RepID=A0A0E0NLW5_ORYRU